MQACNGGGRSDVDVFLDEGSRHDRVERRNNLGLRETPPRFAQRYVCLRELGARSLEPGVGRDAPLGETCRAIKFGIRKIEGRPRPVSRELEIDTVELGNDVARADRVAGLHREPKDLPRYLKRKIHRPGRFDATGDSAGLINGATDHTGDFDCDRSLHVRCRPCVNICLRGARRGLSKHAGQERRSERNCNGSHACDQDNRH